MKNIYVCSACLLKKYCHRLRSLCEGKTCGENRGENMSKSSRINRLHWQYLLCRSDKCFPTTLKDFSENTPWHSSFALSSRSTLIVDRKLVISSSNILPLTRSLYTYRRTRIDGAKKKKEKTKHLQNTRNNVSRSRSHQNIFTLVLIPPLIIESLESEGNNVPVKYKNSTRKA